MSLTFTSSFVVEMNREKKQNRTEKRRIPIGNNKTKQWFRFSIGETNTSTTLSWGTFYSIVALQSMLFFDIFEKKTMRRQNSLQMTWMASNEQSNGSLLSNENEYMEEKILFVDRRIDRIYWLESLVWV